MFIVTHSIEDAVYLGVSLICATPIGWIVGAIGWIDMPDLPLFTNWIEKRRLAALRAALVSNRPYATTSPLKPANA